jgi:eukaryotic-like serine/threonine-protein kinase
MADVPAGLGEAGTDLWNDVANGRRLSAAHKSLLLNICRIADRLDELADELAGRPLVVTNHQGTETPTGDRDTVVDDAIVVERATADRRDARYQSIDEFSDAVERAIGKPGTKRESAEGTARRLLERIRLPKSTDDDLRELLKWALALDENSVDDMKALTGVIPRLSNKVINRLWKFNRDGFARVYARYVGYVESPNSGFPFEDCDALADFGLRAVARTKNQRILRATLTSLTAMGYRHQRWHVREVVSTILQSIHKPEDAVAAVEALRAADIYAVRWALEDCSLPSLDPRLRDGVMALLDDSGTG